MVHCAFFVGITQAIAMGLSDTAVFYILTPLGQQTPEATVWVMENRSLMARLQSSMAGGTLGLRPGPSSVLGPSQDRY